MTGKSGVEMIADERQRQINAEGWTPEHDDHHIGGGLPCAASCYANLSGELALTPPGEVPFWLDRVPYWLSDTWPRDWEWKPSADPIRNLVRAGALIAAEIDRLQRKATHESCADD